MSWWNLYRWWAGLNYMTIIGVDDNIYIMKEDIIELYTKELRSLAFITSKYKIGKFVIKRILRESGITIRTGSETISMKKQFVVSDYINDVIIGELLGDGSIGKSGETSGYFTYTTSKEKYLEWLFYDIFVPNGITYSGKGICEKINEPGMNSVVKTPTVSYKIKTTSYLQFGHYRKKWYPGDKKTIPNDLVITPTALLHWYLGDGSICKSTANHKTRGTKSYIYSTVRLHTNGFTHKDCCFLAKKLNDIGFDFKVVKHRTNTSKTTHVINYQLRLSCPSKNNSGFFDFIGECPISLIDIYGYKWDWNTKIIDRIKR